MITGFIQDAESWSYLLAYCADLPGAIDGEKRTEANLGRRVQAILQKRNGWKSYNAPNYSTACDLVKKHYYGKLARVEMSESEGFEIGKALLQYSVEVLVKAARLAHEHRSNKNFLRGLSAGLGGYPAAQMAKAASLWPEWLLDDPPGAQTVDDCRILFALASLPKEHAMIGYLHWRGDSSLTFYQMYQWVLERRSLLRIKDHAQYPVHRRKALGELRNMRETAKAERQEVIQGVIETIRERL